jgi:S-adenosylhomocysteine hydrolase
LHVPGNPAAAEGHPAEVMGVSFEIMPSRTQVRLTELARRAKRPDIAVHDILIEQDVSVAKLKLAGTGHNLDKCTPGTDCVHD